MSRFNIISFGTASAFDPIQIQNATNGINGINGSTGSTGTIPTITNGSSTSQLQMIKLK